MKNTPAKKIFQRVSAVHVIILALAVLLPSFQCSRKPKPTFIAIDLMGAPSAPPAKPSAPEPKPAPEPETPPEQKTKPEPKPEPKPEKKAPPKPVNTNMPPPKVETNAPPKPKPAVTNAPKSKTEDEKLTAIRQNTRVRNPNAKPSPPTRPQLDLSGLKSALSSAAGGSGSSGSSSSLGSSSAGTGSGSGGGGMYSPFAGYYDSVKQRMYAVWQQPAGAPIGLTAMATVRVERDGTVSIKSITRRSGNAQFDQSVQGALNSTVRLPAPPADLPDRDIEIEFVLSD